MRHCLELAGLLERVERLPQGGDTLLEKSVNQDAPELSGGEAQKVALARALYKDSPVVVLDEPTAALDPIAESEVYRNFNRFVGGRGAVFISHRLSSCRFCRRIAVFDEGHLVKTGSHEELLRQNGQYHRLWHAQAQYYAPEDEGPTVAT